MFIRVLLSFCLAFSPCTQAFAIDPPSQEAADSPSLVSWLLAKDKPVRRGFTRVRIALIATDQEWEDLKEIREEVEHALEPPTPVDGFWARKWETLQNPQFALDIARSFQNMARLMRVSGDFPNRWVNDFLVSAISMFSMTHGTEMLTGVAGALYSLVHLDFPTAGAWIGLALPGFYDFGCYLGAGVLFVRPTRNLFNGTRKMVFSLSGAAAQKLGLPVAMDAFFGNATAREKLLQLLQQPGVSQRIELEIPDSELLSLRLRNEKGQEFARLQLRETSSGELALESAQFTASRVPGAQTGWRRWLPNFELRRIVAGLGWNVSGALLTVARLIRAGRAHLIEHEKTFVASSEVVDDTIHIQFRRNAVAFSTFRSAPEPVRCSEAVLEAAEGTQL